CRPDIPEQSRFRTLRAASLGTPQYSVTTRTRLRRSSVKTSKPVITSLTRGFSATAIGRSSPVRHIVIMKILPSDKLTRKSLPTSSAPTNSRLAKQDQSLLKAISYSLNEKVKKINCCRRHQSFSSAKVSRGEFYSVTLPMEKSTRSSTVVTMKTSCGGKRWK